MKWPFGQSRATPPLPAADTSDELLLEWALQRVVEGTDPRIRAIGSYRKRLRPLLVRALDYAGSLAAAIPGPRPFCRRGWVEDPVVHALFSTADSLVRTFSYNPDLHALFDDHASIEAAFALLTVRRDEANTFGSAVRGEMLIRDVPQVTLGFSEHRLDLPSTTEPELRARIRLGLFDLLACRALDELQSREGQIRALTDTLGRLKTKQASEAGRPTAASTAPEVDAEGAQMATQIADLERELGAVRAAFFDLDDHIDVIAGVLAAPEQHLTLSNPCAFLDHFNVRMEGHRAEGGGNEICVSELRLCEQVVRVVLVAEFPRAEILPEDLGLEEAERYLG